MAIAAGGQQAAAADRLPAGAQAVPQAGPGAERRRSGTLRRAIEADPDFRRRLAAGAVARARRPDRHRVAAARGRVGGAGRRARRGRRRRRRGGRRRRPRCGGPSAGARPPSRSPSAPAPSCCRLRGPHRGARPAARRRRAAVSGDRSAEMDALRAAVGRGPRRRAPRQRPRRGGAVAPGRRRDRARRGARSGPRRPRPSATRSSPIAPSAAAIDVSGAQVAELRELARSAPARSPTG